MLLVYKHISQSLSNCNGLNHWHNFFDIATAIMTLSSFRSAPRIAHLDHAKFSAHKCL